MSVRHAFKYKFNDYVRCMRVSFPGEVDFLKRITDNMIDKKKNLREISTVMVAVVLEKTDANNDTQSEAIINTVEQMTRHIIGFPYGVDICKILIYYSVHNNWVYQKSGKTFRLILQLFKRFNYTHHHLIRAKYVS